MKTSMKYLSLVAGLAYMLSGVALAQSGKSVGELAKYARADREKLLFEGAKPI